LSRNLLAVLSLLGGKEMGMGVCTTLLLKKVCPPTVSRGNWLMEKSQAVYVSFMSVITHHAAMLSIFDWAHREKIWQTWLKRVGGEIIIKAKLTALMGIHLVQITPTIFLAEGNVVPAFAQIPTDIVKEKR
jgi:hypothetical protein